MSAVFTWGSDGYGRLGHGTEDKNLGQPTEVKALSGVNVKQVTCGSAHNLVADTSGACYTWGKCHYGQLGHGELDRDEHVPRPIDALKGIAVASLVGGDSHVLAITSDGRIYSWGLGYYGTLGHGDEVSLPVPKLIESLQNEVIVSAAAGGNHNFALTDDRRVYVWGRDHCGQLGLIPQRMSILGKEKIVRLSQKVPVLIEFPGQVKMVSACFNHSLVLLDSGEVLSYGCNDHCELGRTKPSDDTDPNPMIDPSHFNQPVTYIKAGWKHCGAITVGGTLYMWGHGSYGRLGLGHCRDVQFPNKVMSDGVRFRGVSCGESHTLALDVDGRLWTWGSNHYGKLGLSIDDGSYVTTPQLLPFQTERIVGVCCGTNHSIFYRL